MEFFAVDNETVIILKRQKSFFLYLSIVMELDDTEVFESDEEGNITGSFEDLDNEYYHFTSIDLDQKVS